MWRIYALVHQPLVQIMACCLLSAKPLSEPMLEYCFFGSFGTTISEIWIEIHMFSFQKTHLKISNGKWQPFCLRPNVLIFWNVMNAFITCNKTGQLHPSSPYLATWGILRTWPSLNSSMAKKPHYCALGFGKFGDWLFISPNTLEWM